VSLLEEVEAKVLQTLHSRKPSLFHLQPGSAVGGRPKIDREMAFREMGLDSLDETELVVAFEEVLGVQLTDEEAMAIHTPNHAIDVFFRKINAVATNKIVETKGQFGELHHPKEQQ
jgi:acyl carrier protein